MPSSDLARVLGVKSVDGWRLYRGDCLVDDNRYVAFYYACRGDDEKLLNVSSYFFTPTTERFAWLVSHDFPHGVIGARGMGPIGDAEIDAAISNEAEEHRLREARFRLHRRANALRSAYALVVVAGAAVVVRALMQAGGLL